ncbi:Dihydrofolate reductase [Xaviernesmea oryzae]|uniref:Dihydrofolate reductase n=1 Tax=Xaviernesmea oryzae TaxID=464029 RepID=A0A1X7F8F4_9HYPH|nr:dihydrofolate reductase family protein [Xaviernesmea oryzae]SMF47960.1 Dihydrofolate reductase [Xaviernesmea oryzae]
MRRIVISAFVSVDGVMQAPGAPQEDTTGGFAHGGWLAGLQDEEIGQAVGEMFAKPFDLLLGRWTYDIFAAYWPYIEKNPSADGYHEGTARIAELFDRVTKFVVTHRSGTLTWANSRALSEDVVGALRNLKREEGPDLLVQGSTEVIQILLENDLLDEMTLIIAPIVLGKGKRFFGAGAVPAGLELVGSGTTRKGTIIARYRRAGDVETGSFAHQPPSAAELERRKKMAKA